MSEMTGQRPRTVPGASRRARVVLASWVAGAASLAPFAAEARDTADPGSRDTGWIVIGGGADDHDRAVVGAAVSAVTREAGGWSPQPVAVAVAAPAIGTPEGMTAQDVDHLLDCSDAMRPFTCVPTAVTSRGVGRLFVVAVDHKRGDGGAPMVVLTARLLVASPPVLVVRQRFCEQCVDDRLTDASAELARQLLQDLAVRSGRTILDVASSPPAARITLDGHPIGATNTTFHTFPGPHLVVVEKPGYRAERRTVVAREGKTASVSVVLVPASRVTDRTLDAPAEGGDAPVGRSRGARWLTGALIGGGAAAMIAGGVLLELGTRDGPDDRYRYPGATPAGAAVGLAGAAMVAAGWYLWWRSPPRIAPSIGMTSRGAVAGWAVAF